jgi:hypothetical protein
MRSWSTESLPSGGAREARPALPLPSVRAVSGGHRQHPLRHPAGKQVGPLPAHPPQLAGPGLLQCPRQRGAPAVARLSLERKEGPKP